MPHLSFCCRSQAALIWHRSYKTTKQKPVDRLEIHDSFVSKPRLHAFRVTVGGRGAQWEPGNSQHVSLESIYVGIQFGQMPCRATKKEGSTRWQT